MWDWLSGPGNRRNNRAHIGGHRARCRVNGALGRTNDTVLRSLRSGLGLQRLGLRILTGSLLGRFNNRIATQPLRVCHPAHAVSLRILNAGGMALYAYPQSLAKVETFLVLET